MRNGSIVSEERVETTGADAALRQLNDIEVATRRINVHDIDDQQVGQVNADYWPHRVVSIRLNASVFGACQFGAPEPVAIRARPCLRGLREQQASSQT